MLAALLSLLTQQQPSAGGGTTSISVAATGAQQLAPRATEEARRAANEAESAANEAELLDDAPLEEEREALIGDDVAAALRIDGLASVGAVLSSAQTAAVLQLVNESLADAERSGDDQQRDLANAHFAPTRAAIARYDLKLHYDEPAVRAALLASHAAQRLQPWTACTLPRAQMRLEPLWLCRLRVVGSAVAAVLGEDAGLFELSALVSAPGARRSPFHTKAQSALDEPTLRTDPEPARSCSS